MTSKMNSKITSRTTIRKRLARLLMATAFGLGTVLAFAPGAFADPGNHDGDAHSKFQNSHSSGPSQSQKPQSQSARPDENHNSPAGSTQHSASNNHWMNNAPRPADHNQQSTPDRKRDDHSGNVHASNNFPVFKSGHSNNGYWNNNRSDNDHRNDEHFINNSGYFSYGQNAFSTFTGTVTSANHDRFDLRVGGTIYNVDANSRLPRGLDRGDIVRVSGERFGNNDIRNASVSIISNR